MYHDLNYDLVVIGAGAGGIGTALAASRMGINTLLLEQQTGIGGTAVFAGVSCWEPSVGGSGIPKDIYERLTKIEKAVGIYTIEHHHAWPTPGYPVFPGGLAKMDSSMQYSDTLRRHGSMGLSKDEGFVRKHWHGVQTEPYVYAAVVEMMLNETGCCDIRRGVTINAVNIADKVVKSVEYRCGEQLFVANASFFADCTADSVICNQIGCEMMFGTEGFSVFNEPDAPLDSSGCTNGVSLIYRISRDDSKWISKPGDASIDCWWKPRFPSASVVEYPNGDWNVNILPTMEGEEFRGMPYNEAYSECVRRVKAHWRYLKSMWIDFSDYEISWIAPRIGVREGPRVVGEHVLTELDMLDGIQKQEFDDIIAITDHSIDMHGSRPNSNGKPTASRERGGEVSSPYGIPFRCLVPRGWQNVLVASRGASFSHIAASSCRLIRTVMRLGQAVGTAVGIACNQGCAAKDVDVFALKDELFRQGIDDLP